MANSLAAAEAGATIARSWYRQRLPGKRDGGVFSSYAKPVFRAAERFDVGYKDILMELGKRKVVGGQEDMIIQVAAELSKKHI